MSLTDNLTRIIVRFLPYILCFLSFLLLDKHRRCPCMCPDILRNTSHKSRHLNEVQDLSVGLQGGSTSGLRGLEMDF